MRIRAPSLAAIAFLLGAACSRAQEPGAIANSGLELVRTTLGVELNEPHAHTVEIAADGHVTLDGAPIDADDGAAVRLALQRVAQAMQSELIDSRNPSLGKHPAEWLTLRIDRRARFEHVVRVLANCDREGIQLWKRAFAVIDPRDDAERFLLERGFAELGVECYWKDPRSDEPPNGTASMDLVVFQDDELRGTGGAAWMLQQVHPSPNFDRATLREWTQFAPVLAERAHLDQGLWLALGIDPERPWCDVVGLRELVAAYDFFRISWSANRWDWR